MKTRLLTEKTATKGCREVEPQELLAEVRELILRARQTVARGVNAVLVALKRAEYGEEIVATLSQQLTLESGVGFPEKNLRRMVQFAEVFPDNKIVATPSRHLG